MSERENTEPDLTLDDFHQCGWQEIIGKEAAVRKSETYRLSSKLAQASKDAFDNGDDVKGRVLRIIADVSCLSLKPESANNPFQPLIQIGNSCSATLDSFSQQELTFIGLIADEFSDIWFKSRFADVAWTAQEPRDIKYALLAIDNYCQFPLADRHALVYWERAVRLCRLIRTAGGSRLEGIRQSLLAYIKGLSVAQPSELRYTVDILLEAGLSEDDLLAVAELSADYGAAVRDADNKMDASMVYQLAANLYDQLNESDLTSRQLELAADCLTEEAESRQVGDNPSNLAARSFYEDAVKQLVALPKSYKAANGVDKKLVILRGKMNEAGALAVKNEMATITSDPIDITESVVESEKAVQGLELAPALYRLSRITECPGIDYFKDLALGEIKAAPLHLMFQARNISTDGRSTAKRETLSLGDTPDDELIRQLMIEQFNRIVQLLVQSAIWPALCVVRREHRITYREFYSICGHCPLIPKGRERMFARALYLGFDDDLEAALHILIPQIEHLVRYHLKQNDVITTHIDHDGIENEKGLSTLMEMPEVVDVFGEDLAFEWSALLCESVGPNYRNELAHGLLDAGAFETVHGVYIWWLCLRLVFASHIDWLRKMQGEQDGESVDDANKPIQE